MLRLLLGALFALACCAPLENDVGKNALQILADHTLITYVHDVQATTRALIAAQGASAKDNFEVKAANATQVISTMQEIMSLLKQKLNATDVKENDKPIRQPKESDDPQTAAIKFAQKHMEAAKFHARQGLRKLKAWAANIPETLVGKEDVLNQLTTLQKSAVQSLYKIEDTLKHTLVERLKKMETPETAKEKEVKKFKEAKKAKAAKKAKQAQEAKLHPRKAKALKEKAIKDQQDDVVKEKQEKEKRAAARKQKKQERKRRRQARKQQEKANDSSKTATKADKAAEANAKVQQAVKKAAEAKSTYPGVASTYVPPTPTFVDGHTAPVSAGGGR